MTIARVGSGSASRQALANHSGVERRRRVSQSPRTDSPTVVTPNPIMTRNDQNTTGTFGW